MKAIKTLTLLLSLSLISSMAFAQNGKVRGTVIDENGEPLFSANAVVKGGSEGTTADFDGVFELSLAPGTYNIELSFIGYTASTVTGVVVKKGEVTNLGTVKLEPASSQLDEVVISVEATRNTETALLTLKKKSVTVVDGISAAKLRLTGDSDAGDAAKRVTGVTVEGGKYVYVRGLGDRYTKTMLNNVDIPGLDPDRNAVQIDIFPTSLISNMTVTKSAMASIPADFAGGVVNIETKEFPESRISNVGLSLGYNPSMHFNSNYLTYEGGTLDALGIDDGTRTLPNGARNNQNFPSPTAGADPDRTAAFVRSFSPTLGAMKQTSGMNVGVSYSLGDQFTLDNGNKLGYIFALTYKNDTRYYDRAVFGEYIIPTSPDSTEMLPTTTREGSLGENSTLLGGLAGIAYKTKLSKYRVTLMHLQNGESAAGAFDVVNSEELGQSGYRAYANSLTYSQRGLTNLLIGGEHHDTEDKWDVEWRISPTYSNIREPDLRSAAFTITLQGDSVFNAGAGGYPRRIWRYLDEINSVERIDLVRKTSVFDRGAKINFGASHVIKYRNYNILSYEMQSLELNPAFNGNFNEVLTDENLYSNNSSRPGLYYNNSNDNPNPNQYESTINNWGAYASVELEPTDRLKTIVGFRAEYFQQRHTGRSQGQRQVLDNELVLNSLDIFPSANVIYALTEDQNLRLSYFRSIARPSFKELSFAQILDPISNRTFNGGLFQIFDLQGNVVWDGNLTETRVNNYDIRWEAYESNGGLLSFGAFVKYFSDAIELVRLPEAQTNSEFQPRNVGDGQVYGAEVEIVKSLEPVAPAFKYISFSGNFTYVYSQIRMSDTEFDIRKAFEKEGQQVDRYRAMAGQAPYVVNAGLSYQNLESKLSFGAFYNVKGRTLEVVGGGLFPDVYTELFHSLNLSAGKSFGKDDRSSINFKVSNLLNDVRESFYVSYNAQDQIFTQLAPGIEFSLSYSYRL